MSSNSDCEEYAYSKELKELEDYITNLPHFNKDKNPFELNFTSSWLIGSSGVGKTTLLNNLIAKLNLPYEVINLRTYFTNYEIDNLSFASIDARLNKLIEELDCFHFSQDPKTIYLIIFENMEILSKKENKSENLENFENYVVNYINKILFKYQYVFLVFSINNSINQLSDKVKNLSFHKLALLSPKLEQRRILLNSLLKEFNCTLSPKYLNHLSQRTNGYLASDLKKIIKIGFISQFTINNESNNFQIDQITNQLENVDLNTSSKEDFNELIIDLSAEALDFALKNVVPSQQIGFETYFPIETVDEVGGYASVKQSLTRIHKLIFSSLEGNAPMGLSAPKGILFHGPSGCGKTLMALAFANYCQLNVIKVKGPQLFSKYFGQTEQIVRDLFKTARTMSPSIIFIDELDSIASKRGFSSNGATGNVKNNVLTTLLNEMDGVEKGDYVLVLACTNRLEFIDDALLRPGRFDVTFGIGLPDYDDRCDIILKYVPNLNSEEVSLIANQSKGYSGAGIHRIISEAGMLGLRTDPNLEKIEFEHIKAILQQYQNR